MKLPTIIGCVLGISSIGTGLYGLLVEKRPTHETLVPIAIGSLVIGVALSMSRGTNASPSDQIH